LSFKRNLRRFSTFGNTQREMEIENVSQRLSSSERTLVHFTEVVKEETSGRNSLWRIHEIARTVGSRRVAGEVKHWIEWRLISL
jgi:hypothetical protein